jgi:hypothetical protein
MRTLATIIDTKSLIKVVWVSFVGGVGLSAVFALAIVGTTRFGDRRREGQTALATVYAVLAAVSLAAIAAALVVGIRVMTTK